MSSLTNDEAGQNKNKLCDRKKGPAKMKNNRMDNNFATTNMKVEASRFYFKNANK